MTPLRLGLLAALGLACASAPLYEGPQPGADDTASFRLTPPGPGYYFPSATSSSLEVYETGAACPAARLDRAAASYRGLVDASLLRNAFTVPADGWVFFVFRVDTVVPGRDRPWRCEVPFGLQPAPGGDYTIRLTIAGDERCLVDVYDAADRRIAPTDPVGCEPWWRDDAPSAP